MHFCFFGALPTAKTSRTLSIRHDMVIAAVAVTSKRTIRDQTGSRRRPGGTTLHSSPPAGVSTPVITNLNKTNKTTKKGTFYGEFPGCHRVFMECKVCVRSSSHTLLPRGYGGKKTLTWREERGGGGGSIHQLRSALCLGSLWRPGGQHGPPRTLSLSPPLPDVIIPPGVRSSNRIMCSLLL